MSELLRQVFKTTPAFLGASLLAAGSAMAGPEVDMIQQIEQYSDESDSMSQVTSVSQFSDVNPGDWAYEALRNLVERYGCIVGYPDLTYRGTKALSRYEFAAGLNACLQQMERLIAASEAVLREDIERLQRLTQEFEAELAALGARVDNLEGRVAFLEDHQFSTTTKLNGEVIMALGSPFGDQKASGFGEDNEGQDVDDVPFFSYRARLNFDTSFTGEDRLRTRLEAGNTPNLADATGTDTARYSFESDSGNDVYINYLAYQTPLGDKLRFHVAAVGYNFDDVADAKNPFFNDDAQGSISRFGSRNPAVYRTGNAAVGLNWQFAEQFSIDVAYLTGNRANSPESGGGVFDGEYLAIAQFNWDPTEDIGLAFTYGYGYQPGGEVDLGGGVGSPQANDPFDGAGATANRFGFQATWRIAEKFNIAGWFGWVNATAQSGRFDGDTADVLNGALNFSVLDLGKEGSMLGFIFGVPPQTDFRTPDDMTYFVEALYKYPITDNISITPGAYVIINANQDDNNDTIVVGTIRTSFTF